MQHPNRLRFEGILTRIGVPSDVAPSGARGHCVVVTRAAAQAALPSLLGMAVDCAEDWDTHDVRRKVGVITKARIVGDELRVKGHLFARDFPEVEALRGSDAYGMSYAITGAHVYDMGARIWALTRMTFTGAAVLRKDRAAYRTTSFRLVETQEPGTLAAKGEQLELRAVRDGDEEVRG